MLTPRLFQVYPVHTCHKAGLPEPNFHLILTALITTTANNIIFLPFLYFSEIIQLNIDSHEMLSYFLWKNKTSNGIFRENICPQTVTFQFWLLWPWKLGQSHQNLICSLLCPNYISMKIWNESNRWFRGYCADKKESHWCQWQHDLHQNQYVSLPVGWGT